MAAKFLLNLSHQEALSFQVKVHCSANFNIMIQTKKSCLLALQILSDNVSDGAINLKRSCKRKAHLKGIL